MIFHERDLEALALKNEQKETRIMSIQTLREFDKQYPPKEFKSCGAFFPNEKLTEEFVQTYFDELTTKVKYHQLNGKSYLDLDYAIIVETNDECENIDIDSLTKVVVSEDEGKYLILVAKRMTPYIRDDNQTMNKPIFYMKQ